MAIPSVISKTIDEYTKKYNQLSEPALEQLMMEAASRDDILPCIQKDTACFLQFLIRVLKPQNILELGTGIGISTLVMASVIPESANITTIERGVKFAKEAEENFKRFNYAKRISLIQGDATEVVSRFKTGYDFIFQDSGKQIYVPTLDFLVNLLENDGILLADDTLFPAMGLPIRNKSSQRVINSFNNAVKEHSQLNSFILPIGHGLTIAQKIMP